ncbi:MAG: hypothetical protein HOE90_08620 [Bacteriovoracaceae bacterium]|nr:hypothetical protein [Bacteriovoracaceae bacterium]
MNRRYPQYLKLSPKILGLGISEFFVLGVIIFLCGPILNESFMSLILSAIYIILLKSYRLLLPPHYLWFRLRKKRIIYLRRAVSGK